MWDWSIITNELHHFVFPRAPYAIESPNVKSQSRQKVLFTSWFLACSCIWFLVLPPDWVQQAACFHQTTSIKQDQWRHPLASSTWTSSVSNPDTQGGRKGRQNWNYKKGRWREREHVADMGGGREEEMVMGKTGMEAKGQRRGSRGTNERIKRGECWEPVSRWNEKDRGED